MGFDPWELMLSTIEKATGETIPREKIEEISVEIEGEKHVLATEDQATMARITTMMCYIGDGRTIEEAEQDWNNMVEENKRAIVESSEPLEKFEEVRFKSEEVHGIEAAQKMFGPILGTLMGVIGEGAAVAGKPFIDVGEGISKAVEGIFSWQGILKFVLIGVIVIVVLLLVVRMV